ncbi:MAG: LiaF transmembrane domain-containing protein [Candidatus Zixiibacteriota bacterium]
MKNRLLRAIIGIILIFTGIVIILSNFGIIGSADFLWDILFILLGVYLFYVGAKKEVLFEGLVASFLMTIGIIGFFYELGIFTMGISSLWPAMFLTMGFYMIFTFSKKRSKWLLYSGVVLVIAGSLYVLKRVGILIFSFKEVILKVWPILLILIGLYIMKGLTEKKETNIF